MKKIAEKRFLSLFIAGVLTLLLTLSFIVSVPGAEEKVTMTGTLYGDDDGVDIVSDKGRYVVKGKNLTDHLYKKVEVTGTVSKDDAGNSTITVTTFKVLEEEQPEEAVKEYSTEEETEAL